MKDPEQRSSAPDGRAPETQPAWRRDFPADWPRDQYVARRDFTKFMVLTSLAFVVGQIWIVVSNWFRRRRPAPPPMRVLEMSAVPVGEARTFDYPAAGDNCILLRTGAETLVAYSQKCTHLSCGVVPDEEMGKLFCPCHHGFFDVATGRPIAGPPRRPLPIIELKIKDGVIYATGVKERTV